ncbi:hypothetical protein OnM2_004038 [Erysiphe neolycopersici]|uniref:Uncharacterized protein n=1 Tax=Erysiphe neolycopersici TaxID=212602 RepID=A0A420I7J6_9PEZI|nr:hypothetical protein OnM2_004038 [Erysiphe neolycopersici]
MELRSRKLGENSSGNQSATTDIHQESPEFVVESFEDVLNIRMDPVSIRVTLKGSTGIRLDRWQDLPLWYDQLKIWCIRNEIWDDVNPEAEGEQPLNQRPVAPQLPTTLDNESRANFQNENAVYTNSVRLWKDKDIALKQLDEMIKSTVGNNFKQHLMGKMTERAKLKSLVQQVRPPIASIKADLKAEYEILKATPYGKPVTEYFSRWQILNIKCRAKEHSILWNRGKILEGTSNSTT